MWYNVIVKKHKNIIQIEISDPVYSFSEVMDHIDLKIMISCGFKAIPHKDCACIAQSDFSSNCTMRTTQG